MHAMRQAAKPLVCKLARQARQVVLFWHLLCVRSGTPVSASEKMIDICSLSTKTFRVGRTAIPLLVKGEPVTFG